MSDKIGKIIGEQMRLIQVNVVLVIFCICCCNTDKGKSLQEQMNSEPFPKIILDTFGMDRMQSIFHNDGDTWFETANYKLFYIGKTMDTIRVRSFITFTPPPPPPKWKNKNKVIEFKEHIIPFRKYYIYDEEERKYKYWTKSKIELRIDTTTNLSNYYPVILTNKDSDTCLIGYGTQIPILMEASDSTGTWKPIQESYKYICALGVGTIILPPNECVLTFAPIFRSNYRTKLRLAIGNNYSTTFYGLSNSGN